jgi:hypothetical protein
MDEPDFEWLMIDANHVEVDPHIAGVKRGHQHKHTSGLRCASYSDPSTLWDKNLTTLF